MHHELKEYDQALEELGRALKLQKDLQGTSILDGAAKLSGSFMQTHMLFADEIEAQNADDLSDTYFHLAEAHCALATAGEAKSSSALEQLAEALVMYTRSREITVCRFGNSHPKMSMVHNGLAHVYKALGKPEEAFKELDQAMCVAVASHGKMHLDVATISNDIGVILQDLGRELEALPNFERCVEIETALKGEGDPDLAVSKYNLALCLQNLGRKDEAREQFLASAAIYCTVGGEDDEDAVDALQRARDCEE